MRVGIASTEAENGGDPISNPGLLFRKRSLLLLLAKLRNIHVPFHFLVSLSVALVVASIQVK